MIGASGVFVSPKLYLAAGISGMMHHVVGIHGAKTIVAINSNPRAPIFAMADYGIVGDLGEVLPALIHHLRTGEGLAPQIEEPGDTRTPEEFKAALRRLRPNLYNTGGWWKTRWTTRSRAGRSKVTRRSSRPRATRATRN